MQNRLATAILMAVGGTLADFEKDKTWDEVDTGEFLEIVGETIQALLKGEKVESGYGTLELTGTNLAASNYNDAAADFLANDNIISSQGGYNE